MSITFNNSVEVFIFIILCSVYVCSILWIYGDAATRDMGAKGLILPFAFVVIAVPVLIQGMLWMLIFWPLGYIAWFILRPTRSHAIVE